MLNDNQTYIAKYMRLSAEDGLEGESNSISNQRLLLDNHLLKMGLVHYPCLEFIDDGMTGSNFQRQGFQELMEVIQKGKIEIVIIETYLDLLTSKT